MFEADIPDHLAQDVAEKLRCLNEQTIEALVVQGLNEIYEGITRHSKDPEFIAKVTSAAKEWAEDCYQW